MKIEIRDAKKENIAFLEKGIKEICKIENQDCENRKFLEKQIRKSIKHKKIKIASVDDIPQGFIEFSFAKKEPYGIDYGKRKKVYCWIEWLYVSKKYRRHKIGKSLLKEIKKICIQKNVSEIMLDVFDINKNAGKFYDKLDFKVLTKIEEIKI